MLNKKVFLFFSFIAGFSTMVIELTAARVIAPILGSSIYTWTSIIGIVLLGTAFGNHFGGKIIDKKNSTFTGAMFFWLAGISVLFIPIIAQFIKNIGFLQIPLWATVILASAILFIIPSFLLGLIYPSIMKLYLHNLLSVGREAGTISAAWAIGSIAGTFLTGFIFIGYIGSFGTLLLISAVLFSCSLWLLPKNRMVFIFSFLYIIIFSALFFIQKANTEKSNIVFQKESNYYTIRVADTQSFLHGKNRYLFLDIDVHSIESANSTSLDIYPNFYPVFSAFNKTARISDIFIIGGGSLEISDSFKEYYPDANVITAEIDPLVIKTAEKYFKTSPQIIQNTLPIDGRLFLSNSEKHFDIIFSDAYSSLISIPWHLTTQEFFKTIKNRLEPGGIFAVNFISARNGESGAFYQSMLKTFSSVFDNYYVFGYGEKQDEIQNVILMGLNSDVRIKDAEVRARLLSLPNGEVLENHFKSNINVNKDKSTIILTDNFAPTDRLMIPTINHYFPYYINFLKAVL